ncbi:SPT4 [Hepatospora eriocheir]|uniref:Transcription elongation factor SPT4 n=1 Tax=Hepatospora eriocheir TaxID=1081669 RepID=A0A1X0QAS2_9MICR|nr:SPT4 [Hepatospora eriocheir]ORE00171.1 SPT4 [Hepatospora eriocheir]
MNNEIKQSRLRACLNCAIILQTSEFRKNGCPNCKFLQTEYKTNYQSTTSTSFTGQICYKDTNKSWVAKWQRNQGNISGYYAMTVEGELPDEFIEKVELNGKPYFNRSNSFTIE